jgi:hypothetical protein
LSRSFAAWRIFDVPPSAAVGSVSVAKFGRRRSAARLIFRTERHVLNPSQKPESRNRALRRGESLVRSARLPIAADISGESSSKRYSVQGGTSRTAEFVVHGSEISVPSTTFRLIASDHTKRDSKRLF